MYVIRNRFYMILLRNLLACFRDFISLHSAFYHMPWTRQHIRFCTAFFNINGHLTGGFFGLFIWTFSSQSRIIHSYWDATFTGEGLQNLIRARHLWPFSSVGSLAWHTYCYMGLQIIKVISKVPWHSHLLPSVKKQSYYFLFIRLCFVAGIRTPNRRSK